MCVRVRDLRGEVCESDRVEKESVRVRDLREEV